MPFRVTISFSSFDVILLCTIVRFFSFLVTVRANIAENFVFKNSNEFLFNCLCRLLRVHLSFFVCFVRNCARLTVLYVADLKIEQKYNETPSENYLLQHLICSRYIYFTILTNENSLSSQKPEYFCVVLTNYKFICSISSRCLQRFSCFRP